jgi:hypothetical protein
MRIHTTLQLNGKTATGFLIPPEVVDALGAGKRPPVRVTINGYTYRSTIAVMGGRYLLGVNAENRAGAGIAAGDQVDVDIELDTQPRQVAVPAALTTALDHNPAARQRFDELSYSNQLRHALAVDGAKTPETRQRRIDKILQELTDQNH